eukprot:gb/GECG01012237.1/.p1 GENE.gb/GECG01012237.1/~~gb/GECG01012237.1/.p1  ORF type:complete len:583 (+),score=57.93 gb/GECG01012237.1/:1-1749(+)
MNCSSYIHMLPGIVNFFLFALLSQVESNSIQLTFCLCVLALVNATIRTMPIPTLKPVQVDSFGPADCHYDSVILLTSGVANPQVEKLNKFCEQGSKLDKSFGSPSNLHVCSEVAGGRLVVANVGPLNRDYDDPRCISDAARDAIRRLKSAGCLRPCLVLSPTLRKGPVYEKATEVALLGALFGCYSPLMNREFSGEDVAEPITELGFVPLEGAGDPETIIQEVVAMEKGRRAARDLCGGDPERTAPPRCAEYVSELFKHTNVKVQIVDDMKKLKKEYPLSHAVGRSSLHVKEHHPRIIRLEYEGSGPITQQVFISGKGITYDTGGADIKAGGIMAGMSRDMGGASAAAGFMKSVAELKPSHLRVVMYLSMVRNSVGSGAYVADEIITAPSGRRVLVVNTDAEGRMVMGDALHYLRKEIVESFGNPKYAEADTMLHTVATLTGHAALAVGHYPIVMDNGPARLKSSAQKMQAAGDVYGEPFEISTLRKDDMRFITPKNRDDHDVVQCNSAPSSRTPRGHQFPMAFLMKTSRLDEHGIDNETTPIAYSHLDIAGAAATGSKGEGDETGIPVISLVARYVLQRHA